LSQTRWKSHIESIKGLRFQTSQIRDVLLKLGEINDDLEIKDEVDCLATYEFENFEFWFKYDYLV